MSNICCLSLKWAGSMEWLYLQQFVAHGVWILFEKLLQKLNTAKVDSDQVIWRWISKSISHALNMSMYYLVMRTRYDPSTKTRYLWLISSSEYQTNTWWYKIRNYVRVFHCCQDTVVHAQRQRSLWLIMLCFVVEKVSNSTQGGSKQAGIGAIMRLFIS